MTCSLSLQKKFLKSNAHELKTLQRIIEGDPLAQLDEQDKELVWRARYMWRWVCDDSYAQPPSFVAIYRNVCMQEFPQSLPKLLQSICWNNRSEVAQMYHLLQKWRPLSPEAALELLDHQYADIQVLTQLVAECTLCECLWSAGTR